MAERTFADLDILIAEIKEIKDEYANMLQQHPVPWSNIIKVSFRARLQVLRESLTNWDEYVNKIQSKIKTMKNDDDEKQKLIDKIDDWKREPENRALKREVSMIILEGQGYLQLDTPTPKTTSEPSNSTPHLSIPNVNIPKFNGDYLKWRSFRQRFEYSIHLKSYPKVEKMIALLGFLEGAALAEVQGFEVSDENYDSVLELLEERFGNSQILIQQLQTGLRNLPSAKQDAQSIRDTVNTVTNMVRQLQNLKVDTNNKATILDIIEKMPKNERIELRYFSMTTDASLDQILEKLKGMALKAEIAADDEKEHSRRYEKMPKSQFKHPFPNQDQKHNSNKRFVCSLCEEDHLPSDCSKFPSVDEKIKQLKLKNGCINCARRNHETNKCFAKLKCNNCSGNHYTFLCKSKNFKQQYNNNRSNVMVSIGVQQGCLLTKRITVINPVTKETADATVFFDSGSQKSYICDQLIHQLKLPRVAKENLHLQGIGARASNFMSSLIKLQIKTGENYEEIYANSIKKIADSVPVIKFDGKFDPTSFTVTNHPPDILIGMDYFFKFISSFEKRKGYVIVNSKVGQMLSSSIPDIPKCTISALAIDSNKLHNYDDEVQNLWKLEAMGIKDQEADEVEAQILENFKESIKFKDNRFYVSWPIKLEHKPLPTNEGLCIGRLNSTLKKIRDDPILCKEYQKMLDDQFKIGKIELAPEIPQGGLVHYLPHHAVITPQKTTTKIRMVFDGSAKCSKDAPSLNDCFVRGPLKMPDICGMLLRIRTCKFLLMGDIEKAFHQIYLNEEDRDAVRFFWVRDPSKPATRENLIIYRFVAVPFGIISSPFILWIIIMVLIQKITNPQLRQMIAENTYVDNLFLMVDDEDQGIEFFEETRELFLSASMNVREWLSNSKKINDFFPLDIKQPDPMAKILGIQWNSQEDKLTFQLNNETQFQSWTKRNVLKFIASSFDPLGMLSPVTLKGKAFIQKLFQQGFPWDTPLTASLQIEWQNIVNDWKGKVEIDRKFVHGTLTKNTTTEIHTFADASQIAYCATVFLRTKTSMGYETSLIFAKTKLKPLNKDLTIPKMEIMGIWLAARISSFVAKELKLEASKKFVWTDSQISFYWFQKWPKDVFVINRLKLVLESNVEVLFVPGKLNPADLGTRGITFNELKKDKCWWQGPSFLQQEEECWPKTMKFGDNLIQTITAFVGTFTKTLSNIEIEREYEIDLKLSWTNFKKKIALKMKNIQNESSLTPNDLMQVEHMLIKQEQKIFINEQIEKHLKLEKDENEIYRIHTRFDHAELINVHPIYLPKISPLTKMIVMDIHEKLQHSGVPHTLSKIRENYWIPAGRIVVQKILNRCKSCKIWKGKPFALPRMPQLPVTRLKKSKPFENTGIDYCGPFKIKGKKEKSWIILFTCFTTRLIHLEPVTSMASDDFLLSFRRFVARKGLPHYILSDNAKQFKTAATTLDKIWKESIQDEHSMNYFNENGITWDYITERAPWKGGLYERLVSLVKNAIKQTVGHRVLDFNEFWTFLTEVESTLNSRPLTYVHAKEAFVIRPIDFISPNVEIRLPATSNDDHSNDETYLPSNAGGGECLAERYYKTVQYLDRFWELWSKDYLNLLRERNNDQHKNARGALKRCPILNERVLVYEPDIPRGNWKTAKIIKLNKSSDGEIRSVEIEYEEGFITRRAINHLYPFEEHIVELHGSDSYNSAQVNNSTSTTN